MSAVSRRAPPLFRRASPSLLRLQQRSGGKHLTPQAGPRIWQQQQQQQQRSFSSTTALRNIRRHSDGSHQRRGSSRLLLLAPGACALLSAVLLSTSPPPPAEAGWWPFSGWGGRGRQPPSPFDDIVPRRARKQRTRAEAELRSYLATMRVPVQELMASLREGKVSRDDFDKQMASFNDEVELSTHRIIFGATEPPDARRRYEAEYGNCRHTPEALQIVASFSPLIELEAGRGHWQRALSSAGATVVSFDKWAPSKRDSVPPDMVPVGKVLPGDERFIRTHRDKTLLLVYPPPGDAALRCLNEYRGDVLVYVGEGRGGANSCHEFFDRLDAEFDVASVVELDPFPQCFERLFVMVRKLVPASEDSAKPTREEPAGGAGSV